MPWASIRIAWRDDMASSEPLRKDLRIAVFAKAPIPGEVKTRLAASIGAEAAADLHQRLVRRTLQAARDAGVGAVELHCAPSAGHPFFRACEAEFGVRLCVQRGDDLGQRMAAAFANAHEEGAALIVIGSDCAVLGASHLREARDALRGHGVVIAPAEDGGYVLVALARPLDLFTGVAWSRDTVLAQTRERLTQLGVSHYEMATLWDVDRPEDYARLQREGLLAEART
jgi:uncharacterized protein